MKNLAPICLFAATLASVASQAQGDHAPSRTVYEHPGSSSDTHSHYRHHYMMRISAYNSGGHPQIQQHAGNNALHSGTNNNLEAESHKAPEALPAVMINDYSAKSSRTQIRKF